MWKPAARGSATTWIIWGLAAAAFGVMLWQFGWLPIGLESPEAGSLVNQGIPPNGGADLGSGSTSAPHDRLGASGQGSGFEDTGFEGADLQADPQLLAAQSEPPVQEGSTDDSSLFEPDEPLSPEFAPSDDISSAASEVEPAVSDTPAEVPEGPFLKSEQGTSGEPPSDQSKSFPLGRTDQLADDAGPRQAPPVRAASSVQEKPGPIPPEVRSKLAEIDALLDEGKDLVAHRELSTAYWVHPDWRPFISERIEKTAQSIYFAPQPHYTKPYVVQPGDQLRTIAKRYNVPWQYLVRLNRVEPRQIRPGEKLKVIKGPFSAHIDLSDMELTVHAWGYFVRRYPIGIGKDGTTPIGKFTVKLKEVNPVYYGPEGVIGRDDPNNPLGERWIDIGDGYGIHGTIDPTSIGKAESRGCIRMYNSDAEEVFDLLAVGSEVLIRR